MEKNDMKENIVNIMAYRAKNVDLARNKPNKFKTKIETEFSEFKEQYPNIFRLCLDYIRITFRIRLKFRVKISKTPVWGPRAGIIK